MTLPAIVGAAVFLTATILVWFAWRILCPVGESLLESDDSEKNAQPLPVAWSDKNPKPTTGKRQTFDSGEELPAEIHDAMADTSGQVCHEVARTSNVDDMPGALDDDAKHVSVGSNAEI